MQSFLHSFIAANAIATQGVLQPFGRFGTAIFVVLITFFVVFFCSHIFLLQVLFCSLILFSTVQLFLQSLSGSTCGDKQTGHGLFTIWT